MITYSSATKPFTNTKNNKSNNVARWRTMDSQSKLFQWELGDDLSVLFAFSRLFNTNESTNCNISDSEVVDSSPTEENITNEQVARYMNLYARLFHRKGPWFTLSDIFMRYYHRDYIRRQSYLKKFVGSKKEQQNLDNEEIINEGDNKTENMADSNEIIITWSWIEKNITDCFTDIHKMLSNGFIRTFNDEQECGIIVGNASSLCTLKDKQSILRKIGGKITSSPTPPTSRHDFNDDTELNNHRSNSRQSKRQKRNQVHRVNEILKQMNSQKTIFAHSDQVMPVRKHVTAVILESFAQKLQSLIVYAANKSKPLQVEKKSINDIISMLKTTWSKVNQANGRHCQFQDCFRLREEPLQTLRRAARLYICAGHGPGNMRNDGTNAWLTVFECPPTPDDGIVDEANAFVGDTCTLPESPDASLWWKVTFGGLNHRLSLKSCNFMNNYKRLPLSSVPSESLHCINIFRDLNSFLLWELVAELRNINDYLIEWNGLVLYAQRKKEGVQQKSHNWLNLPRCPEINSSFDFLSKEGRRQILKQIINNMGSDVSEFSLYNEVENTIVSLLEVNENGDDEKDNFATDAERSICSLGILCHCVLLQYFDSIQNHVISPLIERPWLRHLSWQASMAYIIWDCVEIFEKRGYHEAAQSLLHTILYGTSSYKISKPTIQGYMQVLLSRRVRGKAHDRMITDMKHIQRKNKSLSKDKRTIQNEQIRAKRAYDSLVKDIINAAGSLSSIPFRYVSNAFNFLNGKVNCSYRIPKIRYPSFLRKFSRKLKQPLSKVLEDILNMEMLELSIRLHCIQMKEWTPPTDYSIANALANESSLVGKRCSYIGNNEVDEFGLVQQRSLNVEELAIEQYSNGDLPKVECTLQGGGWKGWHSEGLHIRVLFRILLSEKLLNFDYNEENGANQQLYHEQCTIFLSPYQSSPLDLHVGHCMRQNLKAPVAMRSFYERRRIQIDSLLHDIAKLSKQELSDLIFSCVINRKQKLISQGKKLSNDPQLVQDLKEVRTLSLIAAGLGGNLLAAMFRCLCYDYRQYSGGLADLTLVRASYEEYHHEETCRQIDWGEWIGESFALDKTHSNRALLLDRDDEFLGGTLNDKQKSSSSSNNGRRPITVEDKNETINDKDPLQLVYDGKAVKVEAIFVEVKSVNDTLDERQEDWLNVIGSFGEARVCKFESSDKKKGRQRKTSKNNGHRCRKKL